MTDDRRKLEALERSLRNVRRQRDRLKRALIEITRAADEAGAFGYEVRRAREALAYRPPAEGEEEEC